MKRCKRFISALLCLVMVCAILPLSAAANEDTGDGSGDTTETAKLMGYVGQFVSNGSDGFEWVAGTEGSDSGAVLYGSAENMMIEFYADGTKVTDQLGLSSSNPAVAAIEYHSVGAWTVTIKGAGTTEFSVTISNVTYVYVFSVVDNSGSNESNDQLMFRYADSSEIHSLADFPTEIGTSVDVIFQCGGKDLTTTVIEASPSNVVVFTHKGSGVYTAAIQAAGTVQLRYSGPELVGMSEVLGTVTIPSTTPENPGSDEQLKFMYVEDEDAVWLDMAQFPTTIGETYQLYFYCGGELSGGMFTSSDTDVVEFQGEDAGPNGRLYKFHIAGAGTTTLTYTNGDQVYSAEVTIPEGSPDSGGGDSGDDGESTGGSDSSNQTESAQSVTINGTTYDLHMGDYRIDNTGTMICYPSSISKGIVSDTDRTEFDYYIVLYGDGADASKADYEEFWSNYEVVVTLGNSTFSDLKTAADGYHKYVSITVTGAVESIVNVTATRKSDVTDYPQVIQSGKKLSVIQASQLTLDENGTTTFEVTDPVRWQDYYYYIDLGENKTVNVSGSLTMDGAYGYLWIQDGSQFWSKYENGYFQESAVSFTGQYILFKANMYSETSVLSGSVTVVNDGDSGDSGDTGSPGQLMFHYDTEGATAVRDMSQFPTEIGQYNLYMYYGGEVLSTGTLTSSNSNVLNCKGWSGGPIGLLYMFEVVGAGTTTLTYTSVSGDVTCSVEIVIPEAGSDETLTFHYDEGSVRRDMSQFPTETGQYNLYMFYGDQQLASGTFTSSDTNVLKCLQWSGGPIGLLYQFQVVGTGTTILTYTSVSGDVTCSVEIVIPESSVDVGAAYVGDYVIGFSSQGAEIFEIFGGEVKIGLPYGSLPGTDYLPFHTLEIAAATTSMVDGETVVYNKVDSDTVSLSIKRTWIKVIEDDQADGSTLSFSNSGLVTERDSYSDCVVQLYMKEGYTALAEVYAEVEVTIGSTTETVTVKCNCWPNIMLNTYYERPEDDTVDALNQFLVQMVDIIGDDTKNVYKVVLAAQTYEGTIIIPEELQTSQQLALSGQENGTTVVCGSVNLNSRTLFELNKITFKAPQQGGLETSDHKTTALANGEVTNMYSCTFEGYEVAVDIFHRMVTVTSGNTFIDNEIAIRMDMTQSGGNRLPWVENLYVRNGTAVQILGVSNAFPAYYFRITDSDFIGNDVDFDIQCEGTFYFHRNYFGELLDGAKNMEADDLLEYLLQADTEAEYERYQKPRGHRTHRTHQDGCKVFADIHWKFPNRGPNARNSWETSYTNVLISDWEQETQISNEDTGNMILDSSAFDTETDNKKTIHIVDEHENAIGTWFFD